MSTRGEEGAAYAGFVLAVRRAAEADVPALQVIAEAAYTRYIPRIGRPPAPMTADYAGAVSGGHAWVAVEDGQVVGLAVLIDHGDHLLLENIAVMPAAQRRGIGARLLAVADDQARTLGRNEIRLYTNQAMTENLAYYPRHGYTETHRAAEDGFRRVFFHKRLSD